jgi:hypothetical protein
MRLVLLLVLTFVFFVVGLYAGGFMALILWAMSASSFLLAIERS